ncbi:hypothetical protein ES702_01134 [subsurface metagenome]
MPPLPNMSITSYRFSIMSPLFQILGAFLSKSLSFLLSMAWGINIPSSIGFLSKMVSELSTGGMSFGFISFIHLTHKNLLEEMSSIFLPHLMQKLCSLLGIYLSFLYMYYSSN